MLNIFKKILGGGINFSTQIAEINSLEGEVSKLSNDGLKLKTAELKKRFSEGTSLNDLLPMGFALSRETAKRTLGQRHYDVQLMGGISIHNGAITEMLTGEGKTLATTAPVYLNALTEKGVHVVTVNEYLAKRDTVWMGQIYHALGLKVSCLIHDGALLYDPEWKISQDAETLIDKERDTTGAFLVQDEFLRPISRREAYLADITYGTNHEFGFDYLRDNLAYGLEHQVQRGHYFAIIDEADSILIDEARTPLIIAAPDAESSEFYKVFARVASHLNQDEDYLVDEKMKSVSITDSGIDKAEKMAGIKNIYSPENFRLVHYLEESLKARALFQRDRDYVVKEGEIIIVDQFTGRLMLGRRYSGGLHQAIEAKEGVLIKQESQTYARISIQNYFRLYEKLSGMTGTAQTSAEEFHKVYNLEVISIPPNKPTKREDLPDVIYRTMEEKYEAVVLEVKKRTEKGQPVLLGTPSIEKNEIVSRMLAEANIKHELLNAKNNEKEGALIAQAGRPYAVMVATNMAGRGVDIILGGNPPDAKDGSAVRDTGGLHVIGTERHDARRIDNQLRGRAGRQGDPGSSQFFLSLEDDLLRIFGGDRIQGLMRAMNIPRGMPIESKMVSRAVGQAQAKIEGLNFDARKNLLEYDDVLNKQRLGFYKKRQEILGCWDKESFKKLLKEYLAPELSRALDGSFAEFGESSAALESLATLLIDSKIVKDREALKNELEKLKGDQNPANRESALEFLNKSLEERIDEAVNDPAVPQKTLNILDMLWMSHLENMESLSESVRLRAYAQHDPLVEYRREGHRLYQELFANFASWLLLNLFRMLTNMEGNASRQTQPVSVFNSERLSVSGPQISASGEKAGRNDPCPCGAINPETSQVYKYKKCGLINAPYHRK